MPAARAIRYTPRVGRTCQRYCGVPLLSLLQRTTSDSMGKMFVGGPQYILKRNAK
jgi:hypothetical protein